MGRTAGGGEDRRMYTDQELGLSKEDICTCGEQRHFHNQNKSNGIIGTCPGFELSPHMPIQLELDRNDKEFDESMTKLRDAIVPPLSPNVRPLTTEERIQGYSGKPGVKDGKNKPDLTLVPPEFELAAERALAFGMKKYTREGWRTVPNYGDRYFESLLRHISAIRAGEWTDRESGLAHMDHVAANVAILTVALARGDWGKGEDDAVD